MQDVRLDRSRWALGIQTMRPRPETSGATARHNDFNRSRKAGAQRRLWWGATFLRRTNPPLPNLAVSVPQLFTATRTAR